MSTEGFHVDSGQEEYAEKASEAVIDLTPRRFFLHRTDDVTGVHDDGVIAVGVQFASGVVVLNWLPGRTVHYGSVATWQDLDSMKATHLHSRSNTELIWID